MDSIIQRLSKMYDMTNTEVIKELSPEFDINQNCNHKQVIIKILDNEIEIDEKIADLIKIINNDDFYTIQSCQHDRFGWCSIQFHIDGFIKFTNKLLKQAKIKYNNDMDKIYSLDIIQRFVFNTTNNKNNISCSNYIYDNLENFSFTVSIRFKQSEIKVLENEILNLFY